MASSIIFWTDAVVLNARRLILFSWRPTLEGFEQTKRPMVDAVCLFVLLGVAMVLVGVILVPVAVLLGAAPSSGLAGAMNAPGWRLVVAIVLLGPVVEELIFRSWLTGERRMLVAGGAFAALALGGPKVLAATGWAVPIWADYAVLGAAFGTFAGALALVRPGPPMRAYGHVFPIVFWANAVLFGALHSANYAGAPAPMLILFTLPQMIAGLVFGYARVRIGLGAAIGLHMAFNALPAMAMLTLHLL